MKTSELIALAAHDVGPVRAGRLARAFGVVVAVAAIGALSVLLAWLGLRPDLDAALSTGAFWMKASYTFGLAIAGYLLTERLSRPGASFQFGLVAIGVCVIGLSVPVIAQFVQTPPAEITAALMGSSWNRCPWRILALSLPGLIAALWAMRSFAPTRPVLAGAGAGLLAGASAATIYGLYCQETSAAFLAIWYTLGIAMSAAAGALAGHRLLRW